MKKLIAACFLMTLTAFMGGCKDNIDDADTEAPAAPRGVRTLSLDKKIKINWLMNTEYDVEGYIVYVSSSYSGKYSKIGTTKNLYFYDDPIQNGVTYYYAVSAYDDSGNESELSYEDAHGTARPEGAGVILNEVDFAPGTAGYHFASKTTGPYNDQYTDFYYDYSLSLGYGNLIVWTDTRIQDMGYTANLDEITQAPTQGWSPSFSATAIVGHTYVIYTADRNYAKVRLTNVSQNSITFEWAYQTAIDNTQLKTVPDPMRVKSDRLERLASQLIRE